MSKQGKSNAALAWSLGSTIVIGSMAGWILLGAHTAREFVGFSVAFGCFLAALWEAERDVLERVRGTRKEVPQEVEGKRAAHTGTWTSGPNGPLGMVTTIRYDTGDGLFYVSGWVSDYYQITGEKPWHEVDSLPNLIRELQVDGMVPADDLGTRRVLALMGMVSQ